MADDERPAKIRKVSHERDGDDIPTGNVKLPGSSNGPTPETTAVQDGNTNDVDDAGDDGQDEAARIVPPPDAITPMEGSSSTNGDTPMSKNQQKKLRKKQEWEAKRGERKLIKKEKLTAKRERKREAKQLEAAANGEDLTQITERQKQERQKQPPPPKAVTLPVTILIDCDFDDLMRDNERVSLASQITRCYSDNKNSLYRAHLAVCSFGGKLRHRFDNILTHYTGWRGVRFLDGDFVDAAKEAKTWMADETHGGTLAGMFTKHANSDESTQTRLKEQAEVIYLSSESNDTLTELKPYSTYIIGGLVDKNREKGVCYKRATQRGVRTAKLPIGDYLDMSSRKVLTTNHVNEIMLKWLECGDWGAAFIKAIPQRKGGKLKGAGGEAQEGEDEEEVPEDHDAEGTGHVAAAGVQPTEVDAEQRSVEREDSVAI